MLNTPTFHDLKAWPCLMQQPVGFFLFPCYCSSNGSFPLGRKWQENTEIEMQIQNRSSEKCSSEPGQSPDLFSLNNKR